MTGNSRVSIAASLVLACLPFIGCGVPAGPSDAGEPDAGAPDAGEGVDAGCDVCLEGASRCARTITIERCEACAWVLDRTCVAGCLSLPGSGALAAECATDPDKCWDYAPDGRYSNGRVQACITPNPFLTAACEVESCDATRKLDCCLGACANEGATRCAGDVRVQCNAALQEEGVEACRFGCDPATARCREPACEGGALRCDGADLMLCDPRKREEVRVPCENGCVDRPGPSHCVE